MWTERLPVDTGPSSTIREEDRVLDGGSSSSRGCRDKTLTPWIDGRVHGIPVELRFGNWTGASGQQTRYSGNLRMQPVWSLTVLEEASTHELVRAEARP